MAKNRQFKICKPAPTAPFTSVNQVPLGRAMGSLKLCGVRLYLYLCGNKDGYNWNLNPTAFANWLGVERDRGTDKIITDGIANLLEHKYLKEVEKDQYEFYESPYDELSS